MSLAPLVAQCMEMTRPRGFLGGFWYAGTPTPLSRPVQGIAGIGMGRELGAPCMPGVFANAPPFALPQQYQTRGGATLDHPLSSTSPILLCASQPVALSVIGKVAYFLFVVTTAHQTHFSQHVVNCLNGRRKHFYFYIIFVNLL